MAPRAGSGVDLRETFLKRLWFLAVALAILGSMGLVSTVVSRWTHDVLLDTDSWIETIGPIGTDPIVTEALADRVSVAIIDWLDAEERLSTLLPMPLAPLSSLIGTQIDEFVEDETLEFFQSDLYTEVWYGLNRTAHAAVVAVIRDEVPLASTTGGVVTINITLLAEPIVDTVFARLKDIGDAIPPVLLAQVDINEVVAEVIRTYEVEGFPDWMSNVVVYDSERLATVQTTAAVLDKLVWVLPFLTLLLVGGAVYLAPNRQRIGALLLILGAVGWIVSSVSINSVVASIISDIESSDAANIAAEVFDGITGGLETLLIILGILALMGAVGIAGWTMYQRSVDTVGSKT